jgi:hypothetical protein
MLLPEVPANPTREIGDAAAERAPPETVCIRRRNARPRFLTALDSIDLRESERKLNLVLEVLQRIPSVSSSLVSRIRFDFFSICKNRDLSPTNLPLSPCPAV